MKTMFLLLCWLGFALATPHAGAQTDVFTNNTAIGALNTNYDGAALVISNCTVTIDGPHSFASLQVAAGGVLTPASFPGGAESFAFNVTNEVQILSSTNPPTLMHTNVSNVVVMDATDSVTYTNGVDYLTVFQPNGAAQLVWTNTSAIADGATVLVSYTWTYTVQAGVNLTVAGDVDVAPGGSINASGDGYATGGAGAGATSGANPSDGSGGGGGGLGGISFSNAVGGSCHGSFVQPTDLGGRGGGSYAGVGGSGGGAVQIVAGGNLQVDGVIVANGANATNSRAGGGAGGSIWLVAGIFSGAGSITANGGAGELPRGGGGGGGRISLQGGTNHFAGGLTAYGGAGWQAGGAGTIYTQVAGQTNTLLVDNGGETGAGSQIVMSGQPNVVIQGGAGAIPSGTWAVGSLTVATNSFLAASYLTELSLTVNGTLNVQAGGQIIADGFGYASAAGTGTGQDYFDNMNDPCTGGGYGGDGGLGSGAGGYGGTTYGSITQPSAFGSGGGTYYPNSVGGYGGGWVDIAVNGPLQVDGRISANGGAGSGTGGGGGSGGTVYISATALAGAGTISANGGNGVGTIGGGGGGGRIAVVCNTTNAFAGLVSAYGGGGANWGGAGTIYEGQSYPAGTQLIVDNGGHLATNTPLQTVSSVNLIIRNGAIGSGTTGETFGSLTIFSNAWLAAVGPNQNSGLGLTINGNATIQAGGGIIADRAGYVPGSGSFNGTYNGIFPYGCSGGGHGGMGGNSVSNLALGALPSEYSPMAPEYGGGAGGSYPSYSVGGSGGGVIQLTVSGILQLNGSISANGGNGAGEGGGGGAGGSLNLNVGTLAGTGSVTANGGKGVDGTGGGGGGGCVAITLNTNSFAGPITAYGGGGSYYGGAGTIYLKTNSVANGAFVVDNGGHMGAATLSVSAPYAALTLQNGAIVNAVNSVSLGSLTVNSNAFYVGTNVTSLTVSGNVIVQPGGGINADGNGYGGGLGTGYGGYLSTSPYYPGGGGGHGGYGASGFQISQTLDGGMAGSDTITAPNYPGSGGGGYSPYSIGGKGGGVIQMHVTGTLQVNGSLSANGANGGGVGGGGGAGGALYLTVGGLTGTGTIAANGGNGAGSIGGGGGGGNIAVVASSNLFAGTFSAYGGGGAGYGGAGPIYLQTNATTGLAEAVLMDNGGHRGTNSPLPTLNANCGVILRNGALAVQMYESETIGGLLIASNAAMVGGVSSYIGTVSLTVNGAATIQPGGGIIVDAGSASQTSGVGHSYANPPFYLCSGGGHGGAGAMAASNAPAIGGTTFDSSVLPVDAGSPGGGYSVYSPAGNGGGYVYLHVNGALQVDGTISANGGNGAGSGGGGGSGGGMQLNAWSLAGAGAIRANGGNGALNYGGGGGGGRIAVYYNSNFFAGTMSAYGGGGANYGGAGTVYYKSNSMPYGLLVLDNGGNAGTNTTFDKGTTDVTIQNQAVGLLAASSSWGLHNLVIHTNGVLTVSAASSPCTVSANWLTVDAGGVFSADGTGTGAGGSGYAGALAGGGGHGGFGGGNLAGSGNADDSIQVPMLAGGPGATYRGAPGGGGGGALALSANTITVNGRLSANGLNGITNSGGGAGGSLSIQQVVTLAGTGVISANGGAGAGLTGGGGGGGRIAFFCGTNTFAGQLSAHGGGGLYPGGAGTIYTLAGGVPAITVDNGGVNGTNTPYSGNYSPPGGPFNLTISGGAHLVPLTPLPLLSNLTVNPGATLSSVGATSTLTVAVLSNFFLAGNLTVDAQGNPVGTGAGAGNSADDKGSGGGYGGAGGASVSGEPGGISYGSAAQPVDFGSGGGSGAPTVIGGSDGGGALRVSVGGTLTVNGNLSANGNYGLQDDSGGGSGGSVWITAETLAGAGTISVAGGGGDIYGGAGGGGGRLAIYAPTNDFTGVTNVAGGTAADPGLAGTYFYSPAFSSFQVVAQSPTGVVSNTVSSVTLTFDEAFAPGSVSPADFSLTGPAGPVTQGGFGITILTPNTVQYQFPLQNEVGNYSIQVTPPVANIFGEVLAATYTGGFTIALPTISGQVVDTNGAPVAGVSLQPSALPAVVTDTNGNYSFGVPLGWNGTVLPSFGSEVFVPSSLSYTNETASISGQNFLVLPTAAPNMASALTGTNLSLTWPGITGVTYQLMWSPDLVNWQAVGSPIIGSNGVMQISEPLGTNPAAFFQLDLTY